MSPEIGGSDGERDQPKEINLLYGVGSFLYTPHSYGTALPTVDFMEVWSRRDGMSL